MQLLKKIIHKDVVDTRGRIFNRRSARGIILKGNEILMMYTKHYNDYSFPGGGVDSNEDWIQGLKRELMEETGAKNIKRIMHYGYVDELRPHVRENYDLMHMISRFYICEVETFDEPKLEDYEIRNGTAPIWINIHEAIAHNNKVMADNEASIGFSIMRETFVLEKIVETHFTE